MICGIYMIKNRVNGKMYIGQAVDIEKRWRDHKNGLNGGYHHNEHLQRSWNRDGQENFEFSVLLECEESQLNTMEIDYIAELKTYDPDFGYNKTYGGEGGRPTEETKKKISENSSSHRPEVRKKLSEANKGRTHSEDTKKKISDSLKGRTHSGETKKKISESHSIPVVQIDPSTNNAVNVWDSSKEAQREGGFNQGTIINCCKGKRKTHKGYRWMYLKDWLKEHNKGIPKKLYFID